MAENDYVALDWVKNEIDELLLQARQALEDYVENPQDLTRLRFCSTHIHQIYGTFNVVEFFGAAMLAEEMEKLLQAMMEDRVQDKGEALEVLMQAIIQLPAYLDRVRIGRRDIPIILMPLFNELRAVRGEAQFTEAALFVPNLHIAKEPPAAEVVQALAAQNDLGEVIKKIRQSYQQALLVIVRGDDLVAGFSQMAKIFAKLNDIFKSTPMSYLWWASQGIIEGLSNASIPNDNAIKTLLKNIDKEIKGIIDGGVVAAARSTSTDLLKQMLFYIAKTNVDSPVIRGVKNAFDLENALLDESEIADERSSMSGPDREAMMSVSALLIEEINRIKDNFDIFTRSQTKDKQLLEEALPIFKQLSDTLRLLSLEDLQGTVDRHMQELRATLDAQELPSDQKLFDIAESLVYLETSLNDLTVVGAPTLPIVKDDEDRLEFTPVEKVVVLEARNGLEQVRGSVVEFIASQWDHKQLAETPDLLASIGGGLSIIPLPRAARVVASCAHYVRIIVSNKLIPKWQHLDTLADAIAGVEYYLERLVEDGHQKSSAILDIAEQSMEQLGYPAHKAEELQKVESLPEIQPETDSKSNVAEEAEDMIDDEVVEIFIEEAGEVLEAIGEYFPLWKNNRTDTDSLKEFRRAFHTLKGSGRMVGATDLGELAWSVENMLNRVLDETIPASDNVVEMVETVYSVLPQLVDEFKNHIKTQLPVEGLMARGQALSKNEAVSGLAADLLGSMASPALASEKADALAAAVESQAAEMQVAETLTANNESLSSELSAGEDSAVTDAANVLQVDNLPEDSDELIQIFLQETQEHMAAIDEFIAQARSQSILVNDALQRALHTLKGSSNMAGVLPVAEVVSPLDKSVRSLWAQRLSADVEFVELLSDAMLLTRDILAHLQTGEIYRPAGIDPYLERINAYNQRLIAQEDQDPEIYAMKTVDPKVLANFLSTALNHLMDATDKLDEWSQDAFNDEHRQEVGSHLQALSQAAKQVELRSIYGLADALVELYSVALFPDEEFFNVTKQAHEELINLMDFVAIGHTIPASDEWIAVINDAKGVYSATEGEDSTTQFAETTPVDVEAAIVEEALHEGEASVSAPSMMDDIDPELVAIFLEEADEIQTSITDSLEEWIQEPDSKEHVKQLQRDLHTLKGGARMAGISTLGDFCHQLENLYEGLGEGRLSANDQLFIMLEKCHDRVAAMIAQVSQQGHCDPANDLIEAIKNYGKPAAEKVAQRVESEPTHTEQETIEEVTPTEAEAAVPPPQPPVTEELIEEDIGADDNYDPELVAIFLEEAHDIMDSIGSVYDRWRADPESVMEVAHLQRDLHTLKGGARMAGIKSLGDFCHQLENLYEGLASSRYEPSPHLFKLLERCHDRVAVMLDSVGTRGKSQSANDLIQAIKAYVANPNIDLSAPPATATVAPVAPVTADVVDPEIIEIFMAEAEELIEVIDHTIHDWRQAPNNDAPVDELKRALHTLKGGARLAGLTQLGELAHDFETYLVNVKHQGIEFDNAFFAGILKRQDEIIAKLGLVTHAATPQTVATPSKPEVKAPKSADVISLAAKKADESAKEERVERRAAPREPKESVKVDAELLETLVNLAGETSIARGRVEQGVLDFIASLHDMDSTIARIRNQLLQLDTETQAQIQSRYSQIESRKYEDFDPLEMDRHSTMQQLSRSLIETATDLLDLKETLSGKARDTETILLQQARINTDLQEGLMRTRMVPFAGMVPRLRRIVRQVSGELNKQVDFEVVNAEGEMDRTVLERMVAPLEHMLRNAVDHGIEMPADRKANNKPEAGTIRLKFGRAGGDVVLELSDDGAGINIDAVRSKAIKLGLLDEHSSLPDQEVLQFIMHAGFSTAQKVTQISGRGVGMDVVNSEIKQLGGTMRIQSVRGEGTRFTVHLPFTVSVNRALMVRLAEDMYAVPLNTMRGVVRMNPYQLEMYYQDNAPLYEYGGEKYLVQHLGCLLDPTQPPKIPQGVNSIPLILVPHETQPTAIQIDGLMGSREIVVKTVGPQFGGVAGLSGATILGDGNVVVILDFQSLIYANIAKRSENVAHTTGGATLIEASTETPMATPEAKEILVMVVDDSVTVRKVTTRLLERHNMRVVTAKDGVDALKQLEDVMPDIMLLDIEMPRKDGFEVATEVRQNPRLKHLPIIMITSRTGDKHRDRAKAIGVNRYMGKPYQEAVLLETIDELVSADE